MVLDGGTGFTGIGTNAPASKLHIDGDLKTNTHITASGNISASGQIIAASADFKEGNISNVGNITLDSIISDANSNTEITVGNTQVQTEVDGNAVLTLDSTKVTVGDSATLGLFVDTHITASGNISGSLTSTINVGGNITSLGTITAEQLTTTDDLTVGDDIILADGAKIGNDISGNEDYIEFGADTISLINGGSTIIGINGPQAVIGGSTPAPNMELTVVGDISASGGFFLQNSASIGFDATGSISTQKGMFSVNYGNATQLTGSIAASGDGYGDIVKIGDTITAKGGMYFLDTDSTWTFTNATNDTTGADKLLAIALGINSNIDGMLLKGFVGLSPAATAVVGAPIYMRASVGSTTYDIPNTSGNIVRIVGYSLTIGSEIYFNPDTTFVEVA